MCLKYWKSVLFYGIRLFEGEEGGGGTPAPSDPPAGDPPEGTGSPDEPVSDGRPEGLEDSFWDAENGVVKMDAFIKSYSDTRSMVHAKDAAIREKFIAEQQRDRPESPDKYEIPAELGIENIPEGFDVKFADDDPMIEMWRNLAFQSNFSNDQFMEGIRTYIQTSLENRVDPTAELEKLGENGQDRINRIDLVLNKHLEAEEVGVLADFIGTAEGVEILEKLVAGISSTSLPNLDSVEPAQNLAQSREELEEMMRDPRYTGIGRPRDPAYIDLVTKGFDKLYPNKNQIGQNR